MQKIISTTKLHKASHIISALILLLASCNQNKYNRKQGNLTLEGIFELEIFPLLLYVFVDLVCLLSVGRKVRRT